MHILHNSHPLLPALRIELDQPGIHSICMRADVQTAVVTFYDRKIPFAFWSRVFGHCISCGWQPLLRRRLGGAVFAAAKQGAESSKNRKWRTRTI